MQRFSLFLVLILGLIVGCSKDKDSDTTDCSGNNPSYTSNIKTIMDTNCALSGCHTAQSPQSGYALDTYAGTFAGAANGKFLCSISWEGSCKRMPDGGSKLSTTDINLVSCWIQNGRPQ